MKHDDLYAWACESDFGKPIFENGKDDPSATSPRDMTVVSGHTNAEIFSTPGTTRENFPEISPEKTMYMTKWMVIIT